MATFFAGARAAAFFATGDLAVVLVTRPDLVLERTALDSTMAGAAAARSEERRVGKECPV